jgi:hypothetical protein
MTAYRKLSIQGKQRAALQRARPDAVRCESCGTAVQPDDMDEHSRSRCAGSRAQRDAELLARRRR